MTFEGVPRAPDASENAALRINVDQRVSVQFTVVADLQVTLGTLYFDYGRSNNNSPTTIQVYLSRPGQPDLLLLSDDSTPVTESIGDYNDYAVDLSSVVLTQGDVFTLIFEAIAGSSGGNLDNMALTVSAISVANFCQFTRDGDKVDTGNWLGQLFDTGLDWYFSYDRNTWIFIETLPLPCSGGQRWFFVPSFSDWLGEAIHAGGGWYFAADMDVWVYAIELPEGLPAASRWVRIIP
ncbi:MAG: hypothetical protein LR015_03600 [Verrucomicrobia bacterium]|nr:hypothetical protein [Verrucomicrobiota bacterium]